MIRRSALLCLAAASLTPVWAQQLESNNWMMVTYFAVPQEQQDAYEKFVKEQGQKVSAAAVDSGFIKGMIRLKLTVPFVNTEKWQYANVVYFDKAPSLDESFAAGWDKAAQKAGFASYADYSAKARVMGSKIVLQEVRRAILGIGTAEAGDFIRTAFYHVDPSEAAAWIQRETEVVAPIAKQRIADGSVKAWMVSRRLLPAGEESDANLFVSIVMKDGAGLLSGPGQMTEEWFKKALPNSNYADYIRDNAKWSEKQKLVRVRTYRVLHKSGATPQPKASD